MRKRKTAEDLKKYEQEAKQYMSNLIDFNNEVVFYDNLAEHVDKNYNNHEVLGQHEKPNAKGIVPETTLS